MCPPLAGAQAHWRSAVRGAHAEITLPYSYNSRKHGNNKQADDARVEMPPALLI
jgi:hypothetical protein